MLLTILPFAVTFHMYHSEFYGSVILTRLLWASGLWLALLTLMSSCVILALGLKSLEGREY